MFRLHHVLAQEKVIKADAEKALTKAHHAKAELTTGINKVYVPAIEGGEQYPPEMQRIQARTEDALIEVSTELTKLFDVTLTKDVGNTHSNANVIVEGKTLLTSVPVTYLLWLEKRLEDMNTFVSKLPTLSDAEEWSWEPAQSCFVAKPTTTAKTAKVPTVLVKAKATHEHAEQTEVIHVDKTVGHWTTTKRSGALQTDRVRAIQSRVRTLREAVKFARESANSTEVQPQQAGAAIFGYLFGPAGK